MRSIRLLAAAIAATIVAQPALAQSESTAVSENEGPSTALLALGGLAVAGGIIAIATSGDDDDDSAPVSP